MEKTDDVCDVELIAAAAVGDTDAFGLLVARHQRAARRLAVALVGASDADDVTRDAFVRAYRSLARFRPDAPFRPWLLRIVANQAANHRRGAIRRERRSAFVGSRPQLTRPEPSEVAEVSDRDRRLAEALDGLPAKDREVLVIRYLLDYSEAETAEVLGCAPGTVKSRTSRALGRLRSHTNITQLGDLR